MSNIDPKTQEEILTKVFTLAKKKYLESAEKREKNSAENSEAELAQKLKKI